MVACISKSKKKDEKLFDLLGDTDDEDDDETVIFIGKRKQPKV